jgi:hypothetical protein
MSIEIEENVPVVKTKRERESKYPFSSMKVGNSFATSWTPKKLLAVTAAASYYKRKTNPDLKFKVTTVTEDGEKRIRCWRVA